MRVRGNDWYQILRNLPHESKPYESPTAALSVLGECAIAFMGEISEAEEWFDYIVNIHFTIYPPWGSDPRLVRRARLLEHLLRPHVVVRRCAKAAVGLICISCLSLETPVTSRCIHSRPTAKWGRRRPCLSGADQWFGFAAIWPTYQTSTLSGTLSRWASPYRWVDWFIASTCTILSL